MKSLAGDERVNELTQGEVFLLRLLHDTNGEVFIGEAERSAEGVFDEGFGEAAGYGESKAGVSNAGRVAQTLERLEHALPVCF